MRIRTSSRTGRTRHSATTCASRVLGALLVLATVAVTGAPVSARLTHPTARSTAETPAAETQATAAGPTLGLVSQSSWVAPQATFDAVLDLHGTVADDRLALTVYPAVTSRSRFDDSIRGENLGTPLSANLPTLPLSAFDATPSASGGSQIATSIPVSATEKPSFGIQLTQPGVYPVRIAVTDDAGTTRASLLTHLVRLPAQEVASPLAFSMIVPIHAPPTFQPDGAAEMDPAALTRIDAALQALRTHPGVQVNLLPTPETVEGLAAVDQANTLAGQPADRVASLRAAVANRQVLGTTFTDLDVGSWVAAPAPAVATVKAQLVTGADAVAAQIGVRPDTSTVLADPTFTTQALAAFHFTGTEQLVIPQDQLAPLSGGAASPAALQAFAVTDSNGQLLPAISTDQTLADRLTQTDDPVLNGHLVLADLAVLWGDGAQPRGTVLSVPPDLDVDTRTYDAVFDGLADRLAGGQAAPVVSAVSIDDLFLVTNVATNPDRRGETLVRAYEAESVRSLGELPDQINRVSNQVASYRTMLGAEVGRADALTRQLLISSGEHLDDDTRAAYIDGVAAFVADQYAGIVAPDDQRVTLTAENGEVPITIENHLDYEVEVEVALSSVKLEFPEGSTTTVVLAPESSTRVEVSVVSRASGAFPVTVTVRTPDQQVTVASTRFTVRSTAISGIGLILSIGAGLFLLVWWAMNFRKTRRAKQLVGSNHPSRRPVRVEPDPTGPS